MSTFNRKRQIMKQEPSTQNEIIEMATQVYGECDWHESALLHLERFANLVAAKEREACAKVAEHGFGVIGSTIALAIRARGEQT